MTSEEEEPSVLEYARLHGLVRNYRQLNPLDGFPRRPSSTFDDGHLPQLDLQPLELPRDKLNVSKDALRLLSACHAQPAKPDFGFAFRTRGQYAFDNKMEAPLLRTDPDEDLYEYQKIDDYRKMNILSTLTLCRLPPLEELSSSINISEAHKDVENALLSEKLVLSKEDLLLVQNCRKSSSDTQWKGLREELWRDEKLGVCIIGNLGL